MSAPPTEACAVCDAHLVSLALGETADVPAQAREHLAGCARCREALRELEEAHAAAQSLPLLEPDARVDANILAALDAHLASEDVSSFLKLPEPEARPEAPAAAAEPEPVPAPAARPQLTALPGGRAAEAPAARATAASELAVPVRRARPRRWTATLALAASTIAVVGGALFLLREQGAAPHLALQREEGAPAAAMPKPVEVVTRSAPPAPAPAAVEPAREAPRFAPAPAPRPPSPAPPLPVKAPAAAPPRVYDAPREPYPEAAARVPADKPKTVAKAAPKGDADFEQEKKKLEESVAALDEEVARADLQRVAGAGGEARSVSGFGSSSTGDSLGYLGGSKELSGGRSQSSAPSVSAAPAPAPVAMAAPAAPPPAAARAPEHSAPIGVSSLPAGPSAGSVAARPAPPPAASAAPMEYDRAAALAQRRAVLLDGEKKAQAEGYSGPSALALIAQARLATARGAHETALAFYVNAAEVPDTPDDVVRQAVQGRIDCLVALGRVDEAMQVRARYAARFPGVGALVPAYPRKAATRPQEFDAAEAAPAAEPASR